MLTAHFYNIHYEKFREAFQELEDFMEANLIQFNDLRHIHGYAHFYTTKINWHFIKGNLQEGLRLFLKIMERLDGHLLRMVMHRTLMFYYKLARLYFGCVESNLVIVCLNRISNLKYGNLRADIQYFAWILHLIAHFEIRKTTY